MHSYGRASLLAQLVKNPPAMPETPRSIPEWGRSAGEGIGYPFQYSWISLVAQMVKNLPAIQETWVWSLGWEDPLEEGMVTHSSICYGFPGGSDSKESANMPAIQETWVQSLCQENAYLKWNLNEI